ncbi:MAG: NPCBM/NEW2 domain-containing protein [Ferruginibacter sp.]
MKVFLLIVSFLLAGDCVAQQKKDFHQWAATPPMGWNSWDCYGPTVTEAEVKANADYMSAHLKAFGWEYIIVDIRWFVANDRANGYNQTNPDYSIDQYGRFRPAENRFPSAAGGKGFKPLADYIHAKGLKFGIHIMRGVPVTAVKNNLPVLNTTVTAKDIYSEKDQCTWLRDMYTILPGKKGAQEYYNSIFQLYADWGVDFVKVDDLSSPIYFEEEIGMIRRAIEKTGRKIVLSTSPGETPVANASHVQQHANMWRTVGDFWDSWLQLKEHFAVFERWNQYRMEGAWPDGDMLPLGHIGIRAERGADRMSNFTADEQQTLMTLWTIFRSPLMFGGDLPGNDSFTNALLTNRHVLKVLKNSKNNRQLFRTANTAAWTADDKTTGDKYLAVFNIADQEMAVESKAIWKSNIISRQTPGKIETVDVNISSAKKLFLVVKDGGDNIDWDHADWLNPMLYNEKDSLSLTSLTWTRAGSGWGHVQMNQAVSGSKLNINGQLYDKGIGTHSNSVIEFDLPDGFTKFRAMVGIDEAAAMQNTGATVQCLVFTEEPAGPAVPTAKKIIIDLKALGFNSTVSITDLWTGQHIGSFKDTFAPLIKQHGSGFYRITKK